MRKEVFGQKKKTAFGQDRPNVEMLGKRRPIVGRGVLAVIPFGVKSSQVAGSNCTLTGQEFHFLLLRSTREKARCREQDNQGKYER